MSKVFKKIARIFLKNSPIVFNRSGKRGFMKKFVTGFEDPRKVLSNTSISREDFSKIVSTIRSVKTWKTTKPSRHLLSDKVILNLTSVKPDCVILDIGVSDGSTSLDVIKKLNKNFSDFYVTDLYLYIYSLQVKNITYFFNIHTKKCFMIIFNKFIIYVDVKSKFLPLNWISSYLVSKAPKFDEKKAKKTCLCQPELLKLAKADSRLKIIEWNMFNPWREKKADIIKVANILNRAYFSDREITLAVNNLKRILNPNGKLLIVENRAQEQWSLFKKENSKLILEDTENGGSDINNLLKDS